MDSREQVQAALALQLALHSANLEVTAHHQVGGQGSYEEADYVEVIGALARAGYWLCRLGEQAPPKPEYPRLYTDDRQT